MKTILIPTELNDVMRSILETALLTARKFNSYIEGFVVLGQIPTMMATDMSPAIAFLEEENAEAGRQTRQFFEDFMEEHNVARSRQAQDAPTFGWFDDASGGDSFVGHYGRVFDLIVLGRPSNDVHGPHMSTFEAGLFESGRPILVAPPAAPRQIGTNILIAWNCSTEQARATSLAMPFLRKAERVTVLTVEGATVPGPTGEQMAAHLQLNGIPAQPVTVNGDIHNAGEMILDRASALGCDLLIKGAYTRSRLREMIFGGPTRYILTHATLPVLTAH